MKLAPMSGSLLLELEEVGEMEVTEAANTAMPGHADTTTLLAALASIEELQRKGLVRLVLHDGPRFHTGRSALPSGDVDLRSMVEERLCINARGLFRWATARQDGHVVSLQITDAGVAEVLGP